MLPRYKAIVLPVSLFFVAGLLGACGPGPEPPQASEISVEPSTTILVGESASLTITASGAGLQFNWTASRGSLSDPTAPSVLYTAPDSPGPDTVTVEVISKGGSIVQSITFEVISPPSPPTPTPTATLTQTPTSIPTETPSPTLTSTPILISGTIGESGVYCTDTGGGGTETLAVDPPRTIAQVRIDMQKRATGYGDSLWEVEVYGPDTGDTNLVINGTADASTEQNGVGCEECFAYKAIDGDMTSRWSSDWFDSQWLEITLPEPQVVSRTVLHWEAAYAREYCVTTLPVYALNVNSGDVVPQALMLRGGYTSRVTDDIWIMVGVPGENLWPQSLNACEGGEGTLKSNRLWEVGVGVGGPDDVGRLFEIVVSSADNETSRFISQTLQDWCQQDSYPGFPRGELPAGLTEHQRVTIRRGEERWLPPLDISNVKLPGQVILEGINSGDALPQVLTVSGTYSNEVTDHIWVLVYASDGCYYPQSTNACEGISTTQQDGLWEARIGLGGDGDTGNPFDIIVVLANEDAHARFEERQEMGCITGEYPGYLFIELPRGIDRKIGVSVTRQ